jgi:hypothetical protein
MCVVKSKKVMKKERPGKRSVPESAAAEAIAPVRISKLSTEELQAMYRDVIGRETKSANLNYLRYKLREARASRVRVGPPLKRVATGPQQVLSLRVDEDVVPLLDAAWEKHGMRSRMDLVRRALFRELTALGEAEAASRFAPAEAK